MARSEIALNYGLTLEEVGNLPITEYRLMLFTVFNDAALKNGMTEFKFLTPDEESEELESEINEYASRPEFAWMKEKLNG